MGGAKRSAGGARDLAPLMRMRSHNSIGRSAHTGVAADWFLWRWNPLITRAAEAPPTGGWSFGRTRSKARDLSPSGIGASAYTITCASTGQAMLPFPLGLLCYALLSRGFSMLPTGLRLGGFDPSACPHIACLGLGPSLCLRTYLISGCTFSALARTPTSSF